MTKWKISQGLLIPVSLLLAACNAQPESGQQGIPWLQLLLIVIVIVLLVYWWRNRQRANAAGPSPKTDNKTPAPQSEQPATRASSEAPVISVEPQAVAVDEVTGIEVEVDTRETDTADVVVAPEATRAAVEIEVVAPPAEPDDLRQIEGIGPKISITLQDAGITTFTALAATSPEQLQQILDVAGISRIADPATWPEQARFAAAGDWDGLAALQDSLKGGRRAS